MQIEAPGLTRGQTMSVSNMVRTTCHSKDLLEKKNSTFIDHGAVMNGVFEYQMQELYI